VEVSEKKKKKKKGRGYLGSRKLLGVIEGRGKTGKIFDRLGEKNGGGVFLTRRLGGEG